MCIALRDLQRSRGLDQIYKFMKEHEEPIQELGFMPAFEEIDVDYDPGTTVESRCTTAPSLRLRKLEEDYDPTEPHRG